MVEVKSRRVGGATYQVPVEVRSVGSRAGHALAGRRARKRGEKSMDCGWPARYGCRRKARHGGEEA